MASEHPAIAAHKSSIKYAMSGEKDKWLALFADDAQVHDPVGPSMHDPEGKGCHGLAELSAFWDSMIGPSSLIFIPHKRITCGNNVAAVVMSASNNLQGLKTYIEMVAIYIVNDAGKIASLNVYWDVQELGAQLAALGVKF